MSLYEKILKIYPALTPMDFYETIVLFDNADGNGAFIKEWNHPTLTKPTQEQLDAITE